MSLKVKQIGDYLSATNSLITAAQVNVDASIDSLESEVSSNLSAISADLSSEIATTGSEVTSLTVRISTEESTHAAEYGALSDALADEISSTASEVTSIDAKLASVATTGEVGSLETSLETRLSLEEDQHSSDYADLSTDVSAILAGAAADLDSFAEVISYLDSVDLVNDNDLANALISIDVKLSSHDSTDVVLSNALSAEIATTDSEINSIDVVLGSLAGASAFSSLETRVSEDESDLASAMTSIDTRISLEEDQHSGDYAELSSVNASEVASIDTRLSNEEDQHSTDYATISQEVIDEVGSIDLRLSNEEDQHSSDYATLSTEVVNEVGSIDTRLDDADAGIGSLETALDGFAKEAYIHGIVSNIDTAGGSATTGVYDSAGVLLGDNVTGAAGVATFDLALAVEGNNDVEREANLVLVTINGHVVPASAIRFFTPTQFTITDAQLGYVIEATDVVEYKYIKD